jgi:hypothetical protein
MRAPSLKRLLATFPQLDRNSASLIRELAHETDSAERLSKLIAMRCPDTDRYARSCSSDPFDSPMWRVTMALHAIDRVLGTHGVEPLGVTDPSDGYAPPFEYCNAGDSYATTLIYNRRIDALMIGSWGDIAERM